MAPRGQKSALSSCGLVAIVAASSIIVVIILLLNTSYMPTFVTEVVPHLNYKSCSPCPESTCVAFDCAGSIPTGLSHDPLASSPSWSYDPAKHAEEYGLSLDQCDAAFPGLFTEIEQQIKARKGALITEEEMSRGDWPVGTIKAMIWEGQLYILDTWTPDLRGARQYATMLAINRALIASPDRQSIPNIEFIISIEDFTTAPDTPMWAYDRRPDQNNTWLMPDVGFYDWPGPGIGTYFEVRKRMKDIEELYPTFHDKAPKLFWRGAITPAVAPELRQHLVDQAADQAWADIKVVDWHESDAKSNRVPIEEHCKYQYLVNTEGRAWSGRLKFLQNCHSVTVAHKLAWILPYEYLMVPDGPKQNFIEVKRDFSDLKEKMDYFITHPEEAQRIANNSVATFRDRYLTPAAEACYWRKLIYGYAEVSYKPRFYDGEGAKRKWRGVPFDSYNLMHRMHWDPS